MASKTKNIDLDFVKKAKAREQVSSVAWSSDFATIEYALAQGIGYKAIAEQLSEKHNMNISVNKLVSIYKKEYLNKKKK